MNNDNIKLFNIGEVSKLTDVKPNILRIWEKELNFITPMKNKKGYRVYIENDIEKILLVKKLHFEDNLTIKDIKEILSDYNQEKINNNIEDKELLCKIKLKLEELKKNIKEHKKIVDNG